MKESKYRNKWTGLDSTNIILLQRGFYIPGEFKVDEKSDSFPGELIDYQFGLEKPYCVMYSNPGTIIWCKCFKAD